MYSTDYDIGDLVHLSPSEIVYMCQGPDCGVGPVTAPRFGLAVDDAVCGLILDIREEPGVFGEIMLLVGNQQCWMTYHGTQDRPELRIIAKKEKKKC